MYTKANLAALRVKKDIAELSRQRFNAAHASTSIDFPEGTRNLLKLKVGVSITSGLYEGATFYFLLTIPPSYPFHAPSVVCTTRAWHPNIDLHTGFVSLPILTNDWRPVLSINCVVFALQLMFLEPVEEVAVNEAATSALANPEVFREQVRRTLAGGWMFGVQFEPHTRDSGTARGAGGAAQKRKRGEGMDTEAVQSTLQAMRIQGDAGAEDSNCWDKRPRHTDQPDRYVLALDHEHHHHQQALRANSSGRQSSSTALTSDLGAGHAGTLAPGAPSAPQHVVQQQPPSASPPQQHQETGAIFATNPSLSENSTALFDTRRFQALGQTEVTAAAAGLRCGGLGIQPAGGAQTAHVVPDAVSATPVGWGGAFHAVPAARLG